MASTNITLNDVAYAKLKRLKQPGDSFSDVIVRDLPDATCGELLESLEREFKGRGVLDESLVKSVRAGRGRRSNRR